MLFWPEAHRFVRNTKTTVSYAALISCENIQTSLDTAWDALGEWMTILGPSLPLTDLLFTNEDEARMLTGHTEPDAIARTLRDAGAIVIAASPAPKAGGRVLLGMGGAIAAAQAGTAATPAGAAP